KMITGNNIPVNESGYNGTWSEWNCTWYIDSEFKEITKTNENGVCNYTWTTNCSEDVGEYEIKVVLANTSATDYPISINQSVKDTKLMDDAAINITSPTGEIYYYLDTLNLNVSVSDTCNNVSSLNYSIQWGYDDVDDNGKTISSKKEDSWIVPIWAYGPANLTAILDYEYYLPANATKNLTFYRETSISSLTAPDYAQQNNVTEIKCSISIPGIADKSNYNVTFFVDNNTFIHQTNSSGVAVFNWNTTNYTKGPHNVGCNISDDSSLYFTATDPKNASKTVTIPTDMVVGPVFISSREYKPGTSTLLIENTTVFRNQDSYWEEPQLMFLGANVSTLWSGTEDLEPVDNAIVFFNIMKDGAVIEVVNCTTNLTEYGERGENDYNSYGGRSYLDENNRDYYYNNYVCLVQWNPGNETDVGEHTIFVNATKTDSPGWGSDNFTENISVKGILYVEINSSLNDTIGYIGENITLTARVYDDSGNNLTNDNLSLSWFYDGIEATCPDGHIGVGAGSNFEYVWEIPFSFDDSDYIYDNIKIAALAY
ncbi:MAG: hypothetical protein KAU95_01925, partial [Candidatus Aenigmarchaeota archaeon]|nr:hypothetical protein [Candidatus Aenigmarchaeota archaeon]